MSVLVTGGEVAGPAAATVPEAAGAGVTVHAVRPVAADDVGEETGAACARTTPTEQEVAGPPG